MAPGCYPARAGGLWLRRTLVRSRFHAVVVPSGLRSTLVRSRFHAVVVQGPAHPVNHHRMVMEAQQNAVVQAGLAAVALVLEMVHFAG
jgi:hypothetical protein